MNFKKILLGGAIALSACSAALASADAFATTWIHAKFSGQTQFVCIDSNLTCSTSGSTTCKVRVQPINKLATGFTDNTCSVVVTNSNEIATALTNSNIIDVQ